MKEYVCYKKVKADLVVEAWLGRDGPYVKTLSTDVWAVNHRTLEMIDDDLNSGNPYGYLVCYEDGYRSYSPKDVFERGYTLNDN